MLKQINYKTFLIFFLIFFINFLTGCKTQQSELKGFWENEKKIMEFGDNYFVIFNKDSSEIIAFKGQYEFAERPSYAIKMSYKECLLPSGIWESLTGTELEGYSDTLLFRITKDSLETKVMGNGQKYSYKRTQNPLNLTKN